MKKHASILILLACVVLFVAGILHLFALRFDAGDVYPPYSSLRADPLGTMAFYESLGKMPGVAVRRDFSTSNRLPEEPGTVYLHLAADNYEWHRLSDDLYREIKNFVGTGGRLVIAYSPENSEALRYYYDDDDETNAVPPISIKDKHKHHPAKKSIKKKSFEDDNRSWVNLEEEWGFHASYREPPQAAGVYQPVIVTNQTVSALPPRLAWHSGMIFTNCDAAWQTIYARGSNAVMMERKFGKGSVVIAGDSFFLSNEALAGDRHADLLAWVIGAGTNIVFDEAHLGIVTTGGVASLMRQYRLHGLAAGLLLLAGLFIWKNATSLVPPHAGEARQDFVAGKDSASGFVNLLRRNISPREIFGVCFAEWKKSAAAGHVSARRVRQAEALFKVETESGGRDPLGTYHKISETLGKHGQNL